MDDRMHTDEMTLADIAREYAEKFEYVAEQEGAMEAMVHIIRHETPELSREQVTYVCINAWLENRDDTPSKADLLELKHALEATFVPSKEQSPK